MKGKFATPFNIIAFNEPYSFTDVSPDTIRISPYCKKELGAIKDTKDWLFCPYCGKKIFDEKYNIMLWANGTSP